MVAVKALKERKSLTELAAQFEQVRLAIYPTQVSAWKQEFLERAEKAFANETAKDEESVDVDNLSMQIVQRQAIEGKPKLVAFNGVRNKILSRVLTVVQRGAPYIKQQTGNLQVAF